MLIDLEEARAFVLDRVNLLEAGRVPVVNASGFVLSGDVIARAPVPPFANTAMDGVAIRAADAASVPPRLRLVGTIAAGDMSDVEVRSGEAMRIMTGAPIPPGADAVVMVERCEFAFDDEGVEFVVVDDAVTVGNHIRPVGDDVAAGDVVLISGTAISGGGVALLRTLGLSEVDVIRRPKVGVMSTGDELVEPPAELGRGQIYDSNRAALLALVADAGCDAIDLGLIPDDAIAIEAAIRTATETCDAIVSSGGVSMGDFDLVKAVLDDIGDMRWMQIAIRPAKPFAFGIVESVEGRQIPVFGLPGNPVSSLVSFELLARPALRKMSGRTPWLRPMTKCIAGEDFVRRADGKTHFARVAVRVAGTNEPYPVAESTGAQGSHHLASMALANGFAVLPDGDGTRRGDTLDVVLFNELF